MVDTTTLVNYNPCWKWDGELADNKPLTVGQASWSRHLATNGRPHILPQPQWGRRGERKVDQLTDPQLWLKPVCCVSFSNIDRGQWIWIWSDDAYNNDT